MVEHRKVNVKLSDRQLKKAKNCYQKENRNNSEDEFKNA